MENNEMGTFGLPGTFPTQKMVDQLNTLNEFEDPWNRDMVNTIYYQYKSGVQDGSIDWYNTDKYPQASFAPQVDYVDEKTNINRSLIVEFFFILEHLTNMGEINQVYIQIQRPEADPVSQIENIPGKAGEFLENYWVKFRFLVFAGLGVAGLFLLWPVISKQIAARKVKTKT